MDTEVDSPPIQNDTIPAGISYSSAATITALPECPRRRGDFDGAICCDNPYVAKLHEHLAPCQICVFRLSPSDAAAFQRKGRHFMVNVTRGGCQDCLVFPSQEGEEPVRVCKNCFFNTHKLSKKRKAAFVGSSMMGCASKPKRRRYASSLLR